MKEYAATFVAKDQAPATVGEDGAFQRPPRRSNAKRRLWPPPGVDNPMLPRSWYFRKTLIAGVHGYVGPYAQRMIAPFDIVIAAEGTRFSWEQARMGSQNHPLAIYAFQLPMRVLKQLLLLGGWFDAEKAAELHLVQRVVAQEALSAEVGKFADAASALTVETIAAYKEGIHRMYEIAGLNGMIGIGNSVNAHVAGSRGGEFHGTLNETGNMGEALKLREAGIDCDVTQVR
jgi:enoyl-CoA hydratase/carnithine racemase